MIEGREKLTLDVFNLHGEKLCNLYDNTSDANGRAMNVVVMKERNGWKELSFDLPGVIDTNPGTEKNYRIDYIIAENRIRLTDDKGEDWFILSEPKVSHSGKAKKYSITAGHISQQLKTKNLGLEFSDDEGNNTGTIIQLITTILQGTGWDIDANHSDTFYEDDGRTVKIRSLVASKKTGAFSLVAKACELFDAKPEYFVTSDGEKRVLVKHLNPFERPTYGTVPGEATNDNTVELHYGHALKNVTRTLNSEDMITKLYAYGSYGDKTTGYCAISEVAHVEYTYRFSSNIPAGTEARIYYAVTDSQNNVVSEYKYFIARNTITAGTKIEFSRRDPASKMYVYVLDSNVNNRIALPLTDEPQTGSWMTPNNSLTETLSKRSYADFVMDFTYYQNNGMLTDEQLQKIAWYQHTAPGLRETIMDKTAILNADLQKLSEIIGGDVKFCRLNVTSVTNDGGRMKLNLDSSNNVLYRTDYDEKPRRQFKWRISEELKANGDPKEDTVSVVYITKTNSNPYEWEKGYLKTISGTYDPATSGDSSGVTGVTLWTQYRAISAQEQSNYKFFLFQTYNLNAILGQLEASDESAILTLNSAIKDVTVQHKVWFSADNPPALTEQDINELKGYGWYWKFNRSGLTSKSILYFCYYDEGDTEWHRVWYSSGNLSATRAVGDYWYNWQDRTLKRCEQTSGSSKKWVPLDSNDEQRVVSLFSTVYEIGWTRDQLYKGVYEKTAYPANGMSSALAPGNYALYNGYYKYWLFTTTSAVPAGGQLVYNSELDTMTIKPSDTVIEVENIRPDAAKYHKPNILKNMQFVRGNINNSGAEVDDTDNTPANLHYRSGFIPVIPSVTYIASMSSSTAVTSEKPWKVFMYDENKTLIPNSGSNKFYAFTSNDFEFTTTPKNTNRQIDGRTIKVKTNPKYIRIVFSGKVNKQSNIHAQNYGDYLIVKDQQYFIQNNPSSDDDNDLVNYNNSTLRGINNMVKQFTEIADSAYLTCLPQVKQAQENLNQADTELAEVLGDIQKEGYWEDNSYVNGDEEKLYYDAIKNIRQISKPKATYKIDYLHLNGSQEDAAHWSSDFVAGSTWPQLSIDSAIHLVDPDIDVNIWAYVDKVKKCYDQPWRTTIDINTDLSTIGQKSFTDVMSQIAMVTNHTKNNLNAYDRSKAFGQGSVLDADFLEGKISANKLLIEGGSSSWSTDSRGNMVFVSSDGTSAMTLTGNGFAIANSKNDDGDWNWRTFGTGDGFTADEIIAGTIDAENINVINLNADNINTGTINGFLVGEGTIGEGSLSREVTIELEKGGEAMRVIGPTEDLPDEGLMTLINQAMNLASSAAAMADTPKRTTIGSAQPANPSPGDYWIDTSNGNTLYKFNVTTGTWEEVDATSSMSAADAANIAIANSYQASSGANKITYWNGANNPNIPFPVNPAPKAGDVCIRIDLNNDLYVYSGSQWVLSSAGHLYGTNIEIDANNGTIDITAPTEQHMGSNGNQLIDGGNVEIGGRDGVNITSTADIDIAGGSVNITGASITLDGNETEIISNSITGVTGSFDLAAADVRVGAQTLKIGTAGTTLDGWLSAGGRNYIENSAAVNGTFSWGATNGTLTSGEAISMVSSITQAPGSYRKLVNDGKQVFKLTRDGSMAMPFNDYAYCKMLDKKFTERGTYTWQIKLFALTSYVEQLGTDTGGGDYVQLMVQYRKPSQSTGGTNTFVNNFAVVTCYRQVTNPSDSKFELKPGWNTITRTFEMPEDLIVGNTYDADYCRFYVIQTNSNNRSYSLQFTDVKLERGSTATYWSPAPEDGDPRLTMAWTEIDQDMNKISLSATKVTSDSYNSNSLLLTSDRLAVEMNKRTVMNIAMNETNNTVEATFDVDAMNITGHLDADVVNTQRSQTYTVTTANASVTELNRWLRTRGKFLSAPITVEINAPIKGRMRVQGFKSAPNYRGATATQNNAYVEIIFGPNGALSGGIYASDCDYLIIRGKHYNSNSNNQQPIENTVNDPSPDIFGTGTSNPYGINLDNIQYATLSYVQVDETSYTGSETCVGIRAVNGTNVSCVGCNVVGTSSNTGQYGYGYFASNCSKMFLNGCIGGYENQPSSSPFSFKTWAVYAANGSVVHVAGNRKPVGICSALNGSATISVRSDANCPQTAGISSQYASGSYYTPTNYRGRLVEYLVTPQASSNGTYGTSFAHTEPDYTFATFSNDASKNIILASAADGNVRCGPVRQGCYYGLWYFKNELHKSSYTIENEGTFAQTNLTSATLSFTRKNIGGNNEKNIIQLFYITTSDYADLSAAPSGQLAPATFFKSSHYIGGYALNLGETRYISVNQSGGQNDLWTNLKNGNVIGFAVVSSGYMELEPQGFNATLIWNSSSR